MRASNMVGEYQCLRETYCLLLRNKILPKIWRKYVSPNGSRTPYGYSESYCREQ